MHLILIEYYLENELQLNKVGAKISPLFFILRSSSLLLLAQLRHYMDPHLGSTLGQEQSRYKVIGPCDNDDKFDQVACKGRMFQIYPHLLTIALTAAGCAVSSGGLFDACNCYMGGQAFDCWTLGDGQAQISCYF